MGGHFEKLLESIVAEPDTRIRELDLLPEEERRQVTEEWNRTDAPYPEKQTIHGLFEEQARRTPDRVAVVCGRERLTYSQLNERANRLASYLSRRSARAEVLVGLCVERSLDMVVGLLGILKSGAAYLPLDPAYPKQRLAFMIEDSRAPLVLTQASVADVLPAGAFDRIRLDTDWPAIAGESGDDFRGSAGPASLAYVIYTSGSTGTPKGVAIEHHSTVALTAWARGRFSEAELGGVLASTSVCFDLSVFEIFVPLTSGGKVVIARDALELPELPAAEEVHLVNTVPSAIAELLRVSRLPRSVRTVNLAGEPLAESLVQEILVAGGVARVFDLYGPTEDTTYSTCAPRTGKGRATIGRPLSNKRAYILDSLRQPVPVGVAGDLYVAGAGVARGYLDRPELTAERFLNDPFRAGARMYSTGDRARFLPDGNIQFLGRLDHQVKVRGFRIEIGEIEEALSRHPAIRAGAVVPHGSGAEKRLVAYLVAHNGNPPSAAELRAHLKTTLPDYMVPSIFLFLDALPLTPNGKIDRRALPAPDSTRPLESGYEPPRNPTEEAVAAIWSEVLRIDRVGIHDNFFELGGHSLVATLVFARLQKAFPDALSLRSLFEKPTVAELASALTAATRPEIASLHSNPIVPVSRRAMGTETAEEPEPKGTRSW
jgi:amino acid adenylation domain-containing protein